MPCTMNALVRTLLVLLTFACLHGVGLADDAEKNGKPAPLCFADEAQPAEVVQTTQRAWAEHYDLPIERTSTAGVVLRLIPPGTYMRGAEHDPEEMKERYGGRIERGYDREYPRHRVTLTSAFYMATTPVTQAQWEEVMGTTVTDQKERANTGLSVMGEIDDHPMYFVSWDEAMEFCQRLTEQDREAGRIEKNEKYRLPTEAEWEYACRAGTTTAFYSGDSGEDLSKVAWYARNVEAFEIQPVGQKKPNAFGLYDMLGNITEWCYDRYGEYPGEHVTDPTGPEEGTHRVVRGGCWRATLWNVRAAYRTDYPPEARTNFDGFRVVLVRKNMP